MTYFHCKGSKSPDLPVRFGLAIPGRSVNVGNEQQIHALIYLFSSATKGQRQQIRATELLQMYK